MCEADSLTVLQRTVNRIRAVVVRVVRCMAMNQLRVIAHKTGQGVWTEGELLTGFSALRFLRNPVCGFGRFW